MFEIREADVLGVCLNIDGGNNQRMLDILAESVTNTLYVTDGCTQSGVNIPTSIRSRGLTTSPSFALHLFVDVSKFRTWARVFWRKLLLSVPNLTKVNVLHSLFGLILRQKRVSHVVATLLHLDYWILLWCLFHSHMVFMVPKFVDTLVSEVWGH